MPVPARQPSQAVVPLLPSLQGGGMGPPLSCWQAGGVNLPIQPLLHNTLGSWVNFFMKFYSCLCGGEVRQHLSWPTAALHHPTLGLWPQLCPKAGTPP
jgi:hypothetical protein